MRRFWLRLMMLLWIVCTLVIGATILAGRVLRANAPELAYLNSPNVGFSELMLLDVERRLAIPLAQNLNMLGRAAWSPDGMRLLFSVTEGANNNQVRVMLLDLRDGQLVPLSPEDVDSYLPTWSPDGTQIAFVTLMGEGWRLYTRPAPDDLRAEDDPAGLRQLGEHNVTLGGQLAWARDGMSIAFQAAQTINVNLYIADLGDGTVRELAANIGVYGSMVWLPDDEGLIYTQFSVVQSDIALIDARDGTIDLLTQPPYFDTQPALAPDGRTLAYITFTTRNTLFSLDIETGATRLITDLPGIDAYPASWSPDGEWLAFSVLHDRDEFVYRVRADGTGLQRLTSGAGRHLFPVWRP